MVKINGAGEEQGKGTRTLVKKSSSNQEARVFEVSFTWTLKSPRIRS